MKKVKMTAFSLPLLFLLSSGAASATLEVGINYNDAINSFYDRGQNLEVVVPDSIQPSASVSSARSSFLEPGVNYTGTSSANSQTGAIAALFSYLGPSESNRGFSSSRAIIDETFIANGTGILRATLEFDAGLDLALGVEDNANYIFTGAVQGGGGVARSTLTNPSGAVGGFVFNDSLSIDIEFNNAINQNIDVRWQVSVLLGSLLGTGNAGGAISFELIDVDSATLAPSSDVFLSGATVPLSPSALFLLFGLGLLRALRWRFESDNFAGNA